MAYAIGYIWSNSNDKKDKPNQDSSLNQLNKDKVNSASPTHAAQSILALGMLVCLLVLVLGYCFWGTCWKRFRRRQIQRITRGPIVTFPPNSTPCSQNHQVPAPRTRSRERCRTQQGNGQASRSNRRNKPSDAPPPTYETLFAADVQLAPPSYSSLELNLISESCGDVDSCAVTNSTAAPLVAIVMDHGQSECDRQQGDESRRETGHCRNASSADISGTQHAVHVK